MWRLSVVIVLGCGCDAVFGLDNLDTQGSKAGSDLDLDGRPADSSMDAATCSNVASITVPTDLDTYLAANGPHGTEPAIHVSETEPGVLHFAVHANFSAAVLHLNHPSAAMGCATGADGCEPCDDGVSGTIVIEWLRPDWNENATATERDENGRSWSGADASGAADRGVTQTSAAYSAGGGLTVALTRSAADQQTGWDDQHVALRISGVSGSTAVFGSREPDGCVTTPITPTLQITCP